MPHTTPSRTVPLIVTALVTVGALLTSGVMFALNMSGADPVPRTLVFPDPIGWGIGPGGDAGLLTVMIVSLVLLAGLSWLFTRIVVRAAAPRRAGAVLFGTWGAIIVAAWIAGAVRAPLALAALNLPTSDPVFLQQQFTTISTTGAHWALFWGWIPALVAALLHRFRRTDAPASETSMTGAPMVGAPYAPQPYPVAPQHPAAPQHVAAQPPYGAPQHPATPPQNGW